MTDQQAYIRQLDSHVIDQIAAGEVVERPASIAKELVENALDAGASSVQVDLEGGGLKRICVSDDGVGMSAGDLQLCWHRHATSKLKQASDLFYIETFGFRGEALSSIASISNLAITTRRQRDDAGLQLVVRAGQEQGTQPVAAPRGTTIEVSDIFFNTPARKKFLRSPATEQAHVLEACLRVALGARKGGVLVTAGTRRLLDIPPDIEGLERAQIALGRRVKDLRDFEYESEGIRVHGYVSGANIDRGDTKGIWFFVNGRFVRDRMLARVVSDAFRDMVERGRYPNLIVYLDVNPEAIDVNVHPQKLEVRFSDGAMVYRILAASLAVAADASDIKAISGGHHDRVEAATHRFFRAEKRVSPVGEHEYRPASVTNGGQGSPKLSDRASLQTVELSSARLPRAPSTAPHQVGAETAGPFVQPNRWRGLDVYVRDDLLILACPKQARRQLCFDSILRQRHTGSVTRSPVLLPPIIDVLALADTGPKREELRLLGFTLEMVGPNRLGLVELPDAISEPDADFVAHAITQIFAQEALFESFTALAHICAQLFEREMPPLSDDEVTRLLERDGDTLDGKPSHAVHPLAALASDLIGA